MTTKKSRNTREAHLIPIVLHNVEQLISEHGSVPHWEERLAGDLVLFFGLPIIDPHADDPPQGLVHWSLGGTSLHLVKMSPHGKEEEGIVVVEIGNSLQMELPSPDMTYHVQKRRIRSTRVVMAAIKRAKIVTGDAKAEVDDESIERSG